MRRPRRAHRILLALVVGSGLLLTACGGSERPSVTDQRIPTTDLAATGTTAPPRGDYIVVTTVPVLSVYDSPDAPTPSREFENPWYYPTDTAQQYPISSVFYSEEQRDGWVKVLLPVRPNGSTGWVKSTDVRLVPSRYRIDVDLSEHRLTVYEGDEVFLEDTVAIGKPESPTPIGKFYIRILVKPPDPTTVYGPYAFGLSSHSDAFAEFNGGEAQVGIHGNNDASVLGTAASAGCVRMGNDAITRLASTLPLGTPVNVRQ